jgi:DNA-binding HxlR family transcriptional regulator
MKRKSFEQMDCPVALAVERVGERWTLLILRDALEGSRRFQDFCANLEISTNILTLRLASLVECGLLERRCYSQHPPKYEYLPTEMGRAFAPVIVSLCAWGKRYLSSLRFLDKETGNPADPGLVDEPDTGARSSRNSSTGGPRK